MVVDAGAASAGGNVVDARDADQRGLTGQKVWKVINANVLEPD